MNEARAAKSQLSERCARMEEKLRALADKNASLEMDGEDRGNVMDKLVPEVTSDDLGRRSSAKGGELVVCAS